MRRFLVVLAGCTAAIDVPRDLATLDDAALAALAAAARAEQARRRGAAGGPVFAYAHKQTFATSDPAGAAVFLRDHVGGATNVPMTNTSHTCADGSLSGYTHVVDFPGTPDQPRGFTVHFVYNPRKPPFAGGVVPGMDVDAYTLGERVEAFRRGRFDAGVFDQFVDTHLGVAYESLDPIVDHWRAHDIPFICRTWCCGPGMPQWPDQCPYNRTNTEYCEQGCYVQLPHGIIVEALCGLGGGLAGAQACLTKAQPEIFNLCAPS